MTQLEEIYSRYEAIHARLTEDYYKKHLLSKEDFDHLHANNWLDLDGELIAKGFLLPGKLTRALGEELDILSARVKQLEIRS